MKLILERDEIVKILLKEFGAVSYENVEIQAEPFEVTLKGLTYAPKDPPPPAPTPATPRAPPPVPVVRGTADNPRDIFALPPLPSFEDEIDKTQPRPQNPLVDT